jgi:TPR repeat protein
MELLAFMYFDGRGVERSKPRSYEYYGQAVLGGRTDLRPNLDAVWAKMNETEKRQALSAFTNLQPATAPAPP